MSKLNLKEFNKHSSNTKFTHEFERCHGKNNGVHKFSFYVANRDIASEFNIESYRKEESGSSRFTRPWHTPKDQLLIISMKFDNFIRYHIKVNDHDKPKNTMN